jgi:hypothetical protein
LNNNNNKLVEYFATATVKWGPNPKPHVRSSHMNELTLLTCYNRKARREIQTIMEQQIDTEKGYSFSSSAAAAAAVAGGDGEKLLWIAQRWCVRYRECAEDGHKGLVLLVCGYRFFFLTRELPSFLCDFFSSSALFFPPFVVELDKENKNKTDFLSLTSAFSFSLLKMFFYKRNKNQKKH